MRKYLKYLLPLASFFAVLQLSLVALPVSAQGLDAAGHYLSQTGLCSAENPVTSDSESTKLFTFIGAIIQDAFGLLGIVFLGLTLFAGFKWMTAQGDTKAVTEAKQMLTNAIIGLAIMVLAYSITGFVMHSVSTATTTP